MMEKTCDSSAPNASPLLSTAATAATGTAAAAAAAAANNTASSGSSSAAVQNALRMLSKSSHKISKPVVKHQHQQHVTPAQPATTQPPPSSTTAPQPAALAPPQPQPPVYNINKNDFREVVQKLTGSPAHHNPRPAAAPASSQTPPLQMAKVAPGAAAAAAVASTSRLHKIRPPPLAQLGPRPSALSQPDLSAAAAASASGAGVGNLWMRPSMTTPLSPLPPFPTVSAAAESPITAYMRCLRSGGQQQQGLVVPSSQGSLGAPLFPLPTSPLAFGCVPSPRSAYQVTLPPSPRLPMPSPKWKDV